MSRVSALLLIALALLLGGCRSREFKGPQLFGPGSAKYQQGQAQQFDPYPDTDIGPSVSGGRPDGYTAPAPEPSRGHRNQWSPLNYGS